MRWIGLGLVLCMSVVVWGGWGCEAGPSEESSQEATSDGGVDGGALDDVVQDTGKEGTGEAGREVLPELSVETTPEEKDLRPPRICQPPSSLDDGPYFANVSKSWGLGSDGALQAFGNRLSIVDLDGDGYPDLLIHATNSHERDEPGATPPKRYRWVLMNRPSKADPKRREFVDMTESSGYTKQDDGQPGRVSHFAIFGDVNNDGHVDIFSAVYVDPNTPDKNTTDRSRILLGDGKGNFRLMPKDAGVAAPGDAPWTTSAATFLDYDRDGNLDLFVGFWYAQYGKSYEGLQDRLYRGKGDGTFEDVTEKVGLSTKPFAQSYQTGENHRPTYGVTSCDVDGDGSPDLIVSAYGRQWNMLYLNKNGRFENVAAKVGVDGDGQKDFQDNEFYRCFCAAKAGNCPASVPRPLVQCPAGSTWNRGLDDHPFRLNGNTFTTVCGDINNDGKMDLYHAEIRHWHIGSSSDPSQIILNTSQGDTFSMKRLSLEASGMARPQPPGWNEGDLMAAFFDFDQDGRPDVFLASSDYPGTRGQLFRQLPSSTVEKPVFRELATIAGVGHKRAAGLAVADLDGDGDLDLIVGSSTARCKTTDSDQCDWKKSEVHVYENKVGQKSNWLRVRLQGKGQGGANRMGIGARIQVTAGGRTWTQEISGGYGHFGLHNGLAAHFGLGEACDIEKIVVRWPNRDNTIQTFSGVRTNYEILLKEGDDTVTYRQR